MTNEVQPAGAQAPAIIPVSADPWDDAVEQIVPDPLPVAKVLASSTKDRPDASKDGQIFVDLHGICQDKVRVAVLWWRPTNSWMPPFESGVQVPICLSRDGIVPSGGSTQQPGPCRTRTANGLWVDSCPRLKWEDEHGMAKKKPECSAAQALLLYDLTWGVPYVYFARRTSWRAAGRLKAAIKARRGWTNKEHPEIPYFCFVGIDWYTRPIKNYFVSRFDVLKEPLDLETAQRLAALSAELRPAFERTLDSSDVSNGAVEEAEAEEVEDENNDVPF